MPTNKKIRPSDAYLDLIIEKAKLCKLKEGYVKRLENQKHS